MKKDDILKELVKTDFEKSEAPLNFTDAVMKGITEYEPIKVPPLISKKVWLLIAAAVFLIAISPVLQSTTITIDSDFWQVDTSIITDGVSKLKTLCIGLSTILLLIIGDEIFRKSRRLKS